MQTRTQTLKYTERRKVFARDQLQPGFLPLLLLLHQLEELGIALPNIRTEYRCHALPTITSFSPHPPVLNIYQVSHLYQIYFLRINIYIIAHVNSYKIILITQLNFLQCSSLDPRDGTSR